VRYRIPDPTYFAKSFAWVLTVLREDLTLMGVAALENSKWSSIAIFANFLANLKYEKANKQVLSSCVFFS
jgi:hypothetical protein